jgi:hypothetical protein
MAKKIERDEELGKKAKIREHLLKMFRAIEQAFVEQHDRSDSILDHWDAFNCKLGGRQFYDGNTRIFVPIVRNAIKARCTRFVNQIFPQSGRYVEVTTDDTDLPQAQMSLAEHYIRTAKLRTEVMPALCKNGDVEGQYSIYVTWQEHTRHTAERKEKPFKDGDLEFEELGSAEDMEEEEIVEAGPHVEVIPDNDILILPVTADSTPQAIANGGSVTIVRRWTKAVIKKMKEDGDLIPEIADAIVKQMGNKRAETANRDTKKEQATAAGIKTGAGDKFFQAYETWTNVKVGGDWRMVRAYYGGDDQLLGCKLNPYWCDECPLISAPVEKGGRRLQGRRPAGLSAGPSDPGQ